MLGSVLVGEILQSDWWHCFCVFRRSCFKHLPVTVWYSRILWNLVLDSSWNLMAHGGVREGKWRWKLANSLGSQYPSHYLGTRCIQHYYRWCRTPRLASSRLNWRPAHRADLNWLVRFARKTKSGFCACAVTFQLACTAGCYKRKLQDLPLLQRRLSYERVRDIRSNCT